MLPSRKDLAKEYGVDLRTLQRAIAGLLDDGTLQASDRRGTFVAKGECRTHDTIELARHPLAATPTESFHTRFSHMVGEPYPASPMTIGIIAPCGLGEVVDDEPRSPWVEIIVRSLESECAKHGVTTRFCDLFEPGGKDWIAVDTGIRSLIEQGIDGLIVVDIHDVHGLLNTVMTLPDLETLPLSYVACRELLHPIPHVFYDNRYAGYQAAEHLIHAGYQRLVFYAPYSAYWVTERLEGIQNALRHAGYSEDALILYPEGPVPEHVHTTRSTIFDIARSAKELDEAAQLCRDFLQGSDRIAYGIIAAGDAIAWAVLNTASEQGWHAGVDFGIVGFDDRQLSRTYGLTSLRPPLEALASTAFELLQKAMHNQVGPMQVRLTSQLVVRSSTRKHAPPLVR